MNLVAATDLGSKSLRATGWAFLALIALAGICVLKDGWISSDGSSWLAPTSPGISSLSKDSVVDRQFFQQELEQAEARILNRTAHLLGSSSSGRASSGLPATNVARLLSVGPGSGGGGEQEVKRLRKLQYCHQFKGVLGNQVATSMDPWQPAGSKFLLPLCSYGQISNRLNCLRNYLLLAVLLNRTLVIPELETGPMGGYMYGLVIDIRHARRCIGDAANATIISLNEYRARISGKPFAGAGTGGLAPVMKNVRVQVDRILCWQENCEKRTPRRLWGDQPSDVVFPDKVEEADAIRQVHSVAELVNMFGGVKERLISFGELFNSVKLRDLPQNITLRPELPLHNLKCKMFFQPHPAIVQVAKAFVRTILGPDFLAVHLRRGDFLGGWNRVPCTGVGEKNLKCWVRPLDVVAKCIAEKVRGTNITVVFAATNAAPVEYSLLERLLAVNDPPLALVTVPRSFEEQPFRFTRGWHSLKLDDYPLAFATLDKLICSMSRIFMGTITSTFTDDIVSMRAALGTLSCQDQNLCANFRYDLDSLPFFNETDTDSTLPYRR